MIGNLARSVQLKMDLPVDWSNPQKDMLELIFGCLKDPSDVLHCHGVCRSWYSVARLFSRQHLLNLPPLILFLETLSSSNGSSSSRNSTTDREIVFYNCHSRKQYKFSFPSDLHECWLSGGSHGWIISAQRKRPYKIYLMNAVSQSLIRLPNANSIKYTTNKLRLIMSANPSSDPNCTFLAITPPRKYFAFCRLGDTNWRKLSTEDPSDYGAATFYNGHFYVYYRSGIVLKIDGGNGQVSKLFTEIEGPGRQEVRGSNNNRDDYLMGSNGDLLLISKCIKRTGETEIKVHKLDHEKNFWVEVLDLGNRALFVGYNISITVAVPETDGGEYGSRFGRSTTYRANCVYFIDDSDYIVENQVSSGGERRGVYDMNTQEYKGWITGLRPIWFNAPLSWIRPEM